MDSPWVRLLKEKYGVEAGEFFPKKIKKPYGVSIWRGLYKVEELFRHLKKIEVGLGEGISFWKDRWCSDVPLGRLFPSFYCASSTITSIVVDNYQLYEDDQDSLVRRY